MIENYNLDSLRGVSEEAGNGLTPQTQSAGTPCPTPMRMSRTRRSTGETGDFAMACGRSSCPVCGPILGRRQVEWYTAAFEGRPGLYLCTFTVEPSVVRALGGPQGARAYAVHSFGSLFRPRVARRCANVGGRFAYLMATERHASGAPHLHVLMQADFLVQADLAEGVLRGQAFEAGFGPSMSVRPVEPDRRSVRVAVRYVVKGAFGPMRPSGERIIRASRGLSYYGAAARAERREYVEAQGVTQDDDIVIETAYDRIPPRRRPQGITAEDKERFAALRSGRRRDRYLQRSLDGQRGILNLHGTGGSYRADAVAIDRTRDGQETVVLAENVSPEDARRHLAGKLF